MRVGKSLAVTNYAIQRLEERMGIKGYKDIQRHRSPDCIPREW